MSEEDIKAALSIELSEMTDIDGQDWIDVKLYWHDEVISEDSIRRPK